MAFLVFDGPTRILVDTGCGEGNSYIDRTFAPRNNGLESLLAEHGVAPSDIDIVVNSHLHFDHCGGNSLFPGVPIVVQAAELEAAREPRYTVPDWLDFEGVEFRCVTGSERLTERGSVLATPGHTPGHQSVLVQGHSGIDLIVAQACYTAEEFTAFPDTQLQAGPWSEDAYIASLTALRDLPVRRAYFSHDPTVYRT